MSNLKGVRVTHLELFDLLSELHVWISVFYIQLLVAVSAPNQDELFTHSPREPGLLKHISALIT